MSNEKFNYRKILTSERLPEDFTEIYVQRKEDADFEKYSYFDSLHCKDDMIYFFKYWLEPYENREEELTDLLQESIDYLDDTKWEDHQFETLANFIMNAQNIIWEIKNNAPKLLDDE